MTKEKLENKRSTAKPILFSTDMVQAILDGRKTQTRRVAKGLPKYLPSGKYRYDGVQNGDPAVERLDVAGNPTEDYHDCDKPPYVEGDLLYVRETWRKISLWLPMYEYKASCDFESVMPWRPSIHMPREAARIFLRVKDVRLERLQDITEEDAMAEGAYKASWIECVAQKGDRIQLPTYRSGVANLWDSLYAKRGYGWDANPWAWVITFEVAEGVK